MSNLYISSNEESEDSPVAAPIAVPVPVAQNARPQLNERSMGIRVQRPSRIPAGTFSEHFAYPVESRPYRRHPPFFPPFFQNAKPARMLETGLVRSLDGTLQIGQRGVLMVDDGPSTEVKLMRNPPDLNGRNNYTFISIKKSPKGYEIFYAPADQRYNEWDFYTHTTPVPFVPRPGSIEAAASLPASSQLLGGGGSTSASFPIMASAPPLSPSSYGAYQLPFSPSSHAAPPLPTLPPSADQFPFSPSSYAASAAASAARPPTPRTLQTVTVTPGGKRKVRKTRGRKIKRTRKNKRRHI